MHKNIKLILFTLCMMVLLTACKEKPSSVQASAMTPTAETIQVNGTASAHTEIQQTTPDVQPATEKAPYSLESILTNIPAYNGDPYAVINDNVPFFTAEEITTNAYESYPKLDSLGRCGACMACLGKELMPTEKRGEIGMIKPSGWNQAKYPNLIEDLYLWNRCHLIAFMLAGENDNERNLITGTRYMNTVGMLPYESAVSDYIHASGNHVMYRVTPVFQGNDLVARGVLMEAQSVEDSKLQYCVFCYNVQPGIEIDYSNGKSRVAEGTTASATEIANEIQETRTSTAAAAGHTELLDNTHTEAKYVVNTNSMKFHNNGCPNGQKISQKNRRYYDGDRKDLIAEGYEPAGCCNP